MPQRPTRLLVLFGVLLLIVAGEWWYRRWHPVITRATAHYLIQSSATPEQTSEVAATVEVFYGAYVKLFSDFTHNRLHEKLRLNLYKDRQEFRRCNRGVGWAEAFYVKPVCHAYYSQQEVNSYHWMAHEAVHQLNREVAGLDLPLWLDEGAATYFSTSVLRKGVLEPGRIDRFTYPIWWLGKLALSGDLQRDIATTNFIPLHVIITGKGGPDKDEQFNLYYMHWWGLTHFLLHYENAKYREGYFKVVRDGGTPQSVEKNLGPIERVQSEWYVYFRKCAAEYR
ncbi:MAG: hypothetical protein WCO56_24360 [Verrucomicrobiota bacterium]